MRFDFLYVLTKEKILKRMNCLEIIDARIHVQNKEADYRQEEQKYHCIFHPHQYDDNDNLQRHQIKKRIL